MIIHKNIHSCIMLEDKGKAILIDPGKYGYEDFPLDLNKIKFLNYLLITHRHSDHMYIPFIKNILNKFPEVEIISNLEVTNILSEDSIHASTEGNQFIKFNLLQHETSFDSNTPQNTVFIIFDRFTHTGDNLQYANKTDIMTLPIDCGLWGNVSLAIKRLIKLKPKFVIPIHDFRIKDEIRKDVYKRMSEYFKSFNINFLPMLPGDNISI